MFQKKNKVRLTRVKKVILINIFKATTPAPSSKKRKHEDESPTSNKKARVMRVAIYFSISTNYGIAI